MSEISENKVLYRYDGHAFSHGGCDINGDYIHSHSSYKVLLHEYDIIKETPKGFWIDYYSNYSHGNKKFVRKEGIKKYASQTKEGAKKDFIARRNKQISILESRLERSKLELEIAKKMQIDINDNSHKDLVELFI